MSNLINEELETIKYLFGYKKGKVISEQEKPVTPVSVPTAPAAAPTALTAPDVIKKIQEVLNSKYGAKLTVDGKWGPKTQAAFESTSVVKNPVNLTTQTPKHGERKVDEVGNTSVYDGYNKKWVSDSEYLKLYNTDGTVKTTVASTQTTAAPAAAPAAAPTTAAPAVPAAPAAAPTTAAPAAAPTTAAPKSNRDQRRERQDLRRINKRAMQDLRAQQRTQQ
jgi:hypothetical protein